MLVVNIGDWLGENGDVPLKPERLRRNAVRVAQIIEYGGPLEPGQMRETLLMCSKRPQRMACTGLLWVAKKEDDTIYAYCPVCRRDETVVSGWKDTLWADGMMEPLSVPPSETTLTKH